MRGRKQGRTVVLLGLMGVLALPVATVAGRTDDPPKPVGDAKVVREADGPASAELRAMAKADQEDRAWFLKGQALSDADRDRMVAGDAKRLARVRFLVKRDKIVTVQDFDNAALLFQHGETPDDILIAHELAFIALLKATGRGASNLPVLAEDRFLERIGRKQRFGSQGRAQNAAGEGGTQISDVDEDGDLAVTDALRADLFMPPLAASKQKGSAALTDHIETIIARLKQRYDPAWQAAEAKRPAARELQHLARASASEAAVGQVLALYRADELRTPADYVNAGTVLLRAADATQNTAANRETTARRLLLAHEFAMVAALRKHPAGPNLFARTWDRFLVVVAQPQRYGTYRERRGNRTAVVGSRADSANATVRRTFGVATIPLPSPTRL